MKKKKNDQKKVAKVVLSENIHKRSKKQKILNQQNIDQNDQDIINSKKMSHVQKKIQKNLQIINNKQNNTLKKVKTNKNLQQNKYQTKKLLKSYQIEDEQLDDEVMQEILKLAKSAAFARENQGKQMEIEFDDDGDDDDNDNNEEEDKFGKKTEVQPKSQQIKKLFQQQFEIKVAGFSDKVTKEQLQQFFSQFISDIISINLQNNIAFIKIASKKSLDILLNQNGIQYMGRILALESAITRKLPLNEASINAKSVFVGNLSFNTNEKELANAFQHFGEIEDSRIARDKETGNNIFKSKGYGHIEFLTSQSAAQALEMNGKKINGRPVKVNYSFAKELPQIQNAFEENSDQFEGKRNENFKRDQIRGSAIRIASKQFESVRTGAFIPGSFLGQKKKL